MLEQNFDIGDYDIEELDTPPDKRETVSVLSSLHRCNTDNARWLGIYELFVKLKKEGNYDIGGCYTNDEPDLWFYYTTTSCPQEAYLLNLFVCHRKTGSFTIGVSTSNNLSYDATSDPKSATLQDSLSWYRFESSRKDQNHYIKTFCFNHLDRESLKNTVLFIPISIEMESKFAMNNLLLETIQLEHNSKSIFSMGKDTDFAIISANGNKFPVHKIVLAAHSRELRSLIKRNDSSLHLDLGDNEVGFFIKYMYKGTVVDLKNQDINRLLEITQVYKFEALAKMIEYLMEKQIDVMNAVEIAMIAKKYHMTSLQYKVFNFIKNNPEVLNTDGWKSLSDVHLAKALFEYNQVKI